MIISIEMNNQMLADFFKNAGYASEFIPTQEWREVGHNNLKEFTRDVLHVITKKGEKKPAKEVFEQVMKLRAVRPDQITINQVNSILNNN